MPLLYPKHSEALYQALQPDPYFAALESWVETGSPKAAMLAYYDFSMREARTFGRIYLPEKAEHGVSVWLKPLASQQAAEKQHQRQSFLVEHFGEGVLDRYLAAMAGMTANAAPLIDADAWYLSIVGVLPEFQNRGLGASLILPILEEADRAGVSTYLETFTPRNKSFYGRMGYEDAGIFLETVTGAEYSLMVRPARRQQSRLSRSRGLGG